MRTKKIISFTLLTVSPMFFLGCTNAQKQKELNQEYQKTKTKYERIKEENEDLQMEVHVKKRSIKDAKANQAKFKNELQELQK